MKVLIVEDEKPAADRIIHLLRKVDNTISIAGITETVEDSINWMQENPAPDFILMDIQLDDGICFEIFETIKVTVPVIFTTAYDEYAIRAFKVNSVDYLLKPIEEDALKAAIEKLKALHLKESGNNELIEKLISGINKPYKSRFLVKVGQHYKSVSVNEIACFFVSERSTFIRTFSGRDFCLEYSLEQLQKIADPEKFFRINRNYLVNIDAITDIVSYSTSRLRIKLKDQKPDDELIVSRDNVSDFKRWMDR